MQFEIALSNVLLTLFYIVPGYIICKMKKASADHLSTISSILIYGCAPCLIISSFLKLDFSVTDVGKMGLFFLITLLLQAAFMGLVFLLFRRRFADSKYRILTIASVLGNVGFFGLPIVRALVPDHPEVMCYSIIYVISMNILVFTVGAFCITGRKEFMTLRAGIFNPSMFGLVIAFPLYLIGAKSFLPDLLMDGVNLLGTMSTPLCMLILGVRLAGISPSAATVASTAACSRAIRERNFIVNKPLSIVGILDYSKSADKVQAIWENGADKKSSVFYTNVKHVEKTVLSGAFHVQ